MHLPAASPPLRGLLLRLLARLTAVGLLRDLLLAKVRRDENRIGVVANRVKRNTVIYQSLMRFLETLRIPVIATLRDSQNYVRASEQGLGLHEMKRNMVEQDVADWEPMLAWLKAKEGAWRETA